MLKMVTQYYGVWEPSPTAAQRLAFLENVLMPKITFEQLQTSLRLRGKILGAHTKAELTSMLGSCLAVEVESLEGDEQVKEIREMERAIEAYMVRNQAKKAKKVRFRHLLPCRASLTVVTSRTAQAKAAGDMGALACNPRSQEGPARHRCCSHGDGERGAV